MDIIIKPLIDLLVFTLIFLSPIIIKQAIIY